MGGAAVPGRCPGVVFYLTITPRRWQAGILARWIAASTDGRRDRGPRPLVGMAARSLRRLLLPRHHRRPRGGRRRRALRADRLGVLPLPPGFRARRGPPRGAFG